MAKRYLDIVVATLALALLAPLLLAVAALIRLDDGGPALFTQWRLGRNRRPYRIHKFRSMREERVTRLGAWLRATGIDELPQLINVLRGDMSLIGPRPLTAADVARLGWDDDAHALRWRVCPGITGLAQIYAGRGARLSWFLDCRYVLDRRVMTDVQIVLISAAMMLAGKRRLRAWLRSPRGPRRMIWMTRLRRVAAPLSAWCALPRPVGEASATPSWPHAASSHGASTRSRGATTVPRPASAATHRMGHQAARP